MTCSRFNNVSTFPRDEAFGCGIDFSLDSDPRKVNLGVGVYRDENGKSWILPSVKLAKNAILQDDTQDHEYLPIAGLPSFISASQNLVFGEDANPALLSRIASVQTISGTGANHTAARFLLESLNPQAVWFPDPTWPNHYIIWDLVSKDVQQKSYPYYNPQTRSLDFTSMMQTLENEAKPGDVILLHACAHNPTGLDPTKTQWREVASLCKRKGLFPLFDAAYLGFATGDVAIDTWPLRHFASLQEIEFGVAQSFSKNFGLYSERVGAFHLVTRDTIAASKAKALLEHIQRGEISTPPAFGARIVATVLGSEELRKAWERDLRDMAGRIKTMRRMLFEGLHSLGTPGDWSVVIEQLGMFSYTGLTSTQVARLRQKYHIYLLSSGRASISGLNENNVEYVVKAIDAVVRESQQEHSPRKNEKAEKTAGTSVAAVNSTPLAVVPNGKDVVVKVIMDVASGMGNGVEYLAIQA